MILILLKNALRQIWIKTITCFATTIWFSFSYLLFFFYFIKISHVPQNNSFDLLHRWKKFTHLTIEIIWLNARRLFTVITILLVVLKFRRTLPHSALFCALIRTFIQNIYNIKSHYSLLTVVEKCFRSSFFYVSNSFVCSFLGHMDKFSIWRHKPSKFVLLFCKWKLVLFPFSWEFYLNIKISGEIKTSS